MRFDENRIFVIKYRLKTVMKYSASQYLLYLLAKKDYSAQQLRYKLAQKGFAEEEAQAAIEQVQARRWQSDERYCEHYVQTRAQQGYGPLRIQQELYQKGIAESLISAAFDNLAADWQNCAKQQFEKKKPSQWDLKAKQKMWRYLLSRGFEASHFRHLMNLTDYDD